MVEGFDHVPFGNMNAVRDAIGPHTAGILVEPIQGEGGVRPASLGKLFAHQWAGIEPDVMAAAKGIAGRFPMGAILAREAVAKHLTDIGFEQVAIDCAIDTARAVSRPYRRPARRCGSPVTTRGRGDQSGLCANARAAGLGSGLVEEDQAFGIERRLRRSPGLACGRDVGAVLLGLERLSYVRPEWPSVFHTVAKQTLTTCLVAIHSGDAAIAASSNAAT